MKYTIRKAIYEDAQAIAKVHVQSWKETYAGIIDQAFLDAIDTKQRTKQWRNFLQNSTKDSLIFIVEGELNNLIGFIHGGNAREDFSNFTSEIYSFYLLKKYQRKSIGNALLEKFTKALGLKREKGVYVCVLEKNPSKDFYIKKGAILFHTKEIVIGTQKLQEVYYGWKSVFK